MSRPSRSQVPLAPLLDIVFIILLVYMASIVGRGNQERQAFSSRRGAIEKSREAVRSQLFDAKRDLAAERSRNRRLTKENQALLNKSRALTRAAEAKQKLLAKFQKRFSSKSKAEETFALLEVFRNNFDIYEVTFYAAGRKVRIVTPKKRVVKGNVGDDAALERIFKRALPVRFDPARAIFVIRAEYSTHWSYSITTFFKAHPNWITTLGPGQHPIFFHKKG